MLKIKLNRKFLLKIQASDENCSWILFLRSLHYSKIKNLCVASTAAIFERSQFRRCQFFKESFLLVLSKPQQDHFAQHADPPLKNESLKSESSQHFKKFHIFPTNMAWNLKENFIILFYINFLNKCHQKPLIF